MDKLYDDSGESMENALRACCKGIKIGKILIHRESGDNGKQASFLSFVSIATFLVNPSGLCSKPVCTISYEVFIV
jgi:hypothetical protein